MLHNLACRRNAAGTRSGVGSAPRSQSSAIFSWVTVEPLHAARGPDASAIADEEGDGDGGPSLTVVLPGERLDRE